MTRFRPIVAIIFALGTLSASSIYTLTFYGLISAGLARGTAVTAIVLSVIAFVLCVRIRSYAVGGMLTLGGVLMLIPPIQAITSDGRILFPGPILGVIFFCPVLILGLVKLARSRLNLPAKTLVQASAAKELSDN